MTTAVTLLSDFCSSSVQEYIGRILATNILWDTLQQFCKKFLKFLQTPAAISQLLLSKATFMEQVHYFVTGSVQIYSPTLIKPAVKYALAHVQKTLGIISHLPNTSL